MSESFDLGAGERLLRKDIVSFVQGPMRVRPGTCYLTNRRVVAQSTSLLAGSLMAVSAIGRAIARKVVKPDLVEVPLRDLVRVSKERYGMNPNVLAFSTGGEPVLKVVFSGRQLRAWLDALDEALETQGKALVEEGEHTWRVRPVS